MYAIPLTEQRFCDNRKLMFRISKLNVSLFSVFRIECEEATEEENSADLPVQGPLPEDPEDAPWRKNESGIRKL